MDTGAHMERILAPRLTKGSGIGLIAPSKSARFLSELYWQRGVGRLNSKGFTVIEGNAIRGTRGHTGDTLQARAADLEQMFRRDDVQAIMAICGGSNASQILDQLDYELIARHPKILIGFSDTTALTAALFAKIGLVTFSGPSFLTFCQPELLEYTESFFDQILIEASSTVQLKPAIQWSDEWGKPYADDRIWHDNDGWQVLRPGQATGKSMGGNLETLLLLAGTSFWPDCTNAILFVECCRDEKPATVNRYLTQLRHMGVFNQIAGLVIGRFPSIVPFTREDTLAMIIEDAARGTDFPIIANVDFGHTDPMVTIPMGIACQLDTAKQEIIFTEPAVL